MNVYFLMIESPSIVLLVAAVIFLLFGASRLPQLAKSLGQSRKAFKEGMKEAEDDYDEEEEEKERRRFSKPRAAQLSSISDEELLEEARRRAAVRRD